MDMKTFIYTDKVNSGRVVVSTTSGFLPESGQYETMVFEAHTDKEEVINYTDLDMNSYPTEQQAVIGHTNMINRWRYKISMR